VYDNLLLYQFILIKSGRALFHAKAGKTYGINEQVLQQSAKRLSPLPPKGERHTLVRRTIAWATLLIKESIRECCTLRQGERGTKISLPPFSIALSHA